MQDNVALFTSSVPNGKTTLGAWIGVGHPIEAQSGKKVGVKRRSWIHQPAQQGAFPDRRPADQRHAQRWVRPSARRHLEFLNSVSHKKSSSSSTLTVVCTVDEAIENAASETSLSFLGGANELLFLVGVRSVVLIGVARDECQTPWAIAGRSRSKYYSLNSAFDLVEGGTELDTKVIRTKGSPRKPGAIAARKLAGSSEQALRASLRTTILSLRLTLLNATRRELQMLRKKGVVGRRAPSCSLLGLSDAIRLLAAFGREAMGRDLCASVEKHKLPTNLPAVESVDPDEVDEEADEPATTRRRRYQRERLRAQKRAAAAPAPADRPSTGNRKRKPSKRFKESTTQAADAAADAADDEPLRPMKRTRQQQTADAMTHLEPVDAARSFPYTASIFESSIRSYVKLPRSASTAAPPPLPACLVGIPPPPLQPLHPPWSPAMPSWSPTAAVPLSSLPVDASDLAWTGPNMVELLGGLPLPTFSASSATLPVSIPPPPPPPPGEDDFASLQSAVGHVLQAIVLGQAHV